MPDLTDTLAAAVTEAGLATATDDQAALRRVAMLSARGADGPEVFAAIVAELARALAVRDARLVVLEPDGTSHTVVAWSAGGAEPSAGEPVTVATPVKVDGRVWGVLSVVASGQESLGQRAERLMEAFSNVLATSVLAAQERDAARGVVDVQRALREIATLAARNGPTSELFAAVTRAAGEVLQAGGAALGRLWPDQSVEYIASWSRYGAATNLGEAATVSAPVTVEGNPWGVMNIFAPAEGPLACDAESRLASFTELLGTAIASAGTRERLARLADEHAALRRVATLVAEGAPREQVYSAVTLEAALHLNADFASLSRIDDAEWMTTLASWSRSGDPIPGGRWPLRGESISGVVARTGKPARRNDYRTVTGPLAELVRSLGAHQGVAVPVIVEDGVWGVMAAFTAGERPLPVDTEQRLTEFTELLGMALANTESRQELAASRARTVATADGARRQIERDLHDGAQQRLVSLGLELQSAELLVPDQMVELREALGRISSGLTEAQDSLREIAHGVHPAILADAGLRPALRSLARRSVTPVTLDVELPQRLAEPIEVAAYYVVKEALDNAGRHARAQSITVRAAVDGETLRVEISDDGVGGANPSAGSGLVGLRDRVEALSGSLRLGSAAGEGTVLSVELPASGR